MSTRKLIELSFFFLIFSFTESQFTLFAKISLTEDEGVIILSSNPTCFNRVVKRSIPLSLLAYTMNGLLKIIEKTVP